MSTTYAVKHSHGLTETHDTYEEAVAAVRSVYTDPYIGHDGDIAHGGESTLVWADEASADDGTSAVATIQARHEAGNGSRV